MKKILTDAVAIANGTARSILWYPRIKSTLKGIELYPGDNSAWLMGWVDKNVFFTGKDGHTMNSDARVMFHHPYTIVTPAMAVTIPGKGSDYDIAFVDKETTHQHELKGKNYADLVTYPDSSTDPGHHSYRRIPFLHANGSASFSGAGSHTFSHIGIVYIHALDPGHLPGLWWQGLSEKKRKTVLL